MGRTKDTADAMRPIAIILESSQASLPQAMIGVLENTREMLKMLRDKYNALDCDFDSASAAREALTSSSEPLARHVCQQALMLMAISMLDSHIAEMKRNQQLDSNLDRLIAESERSSTGCDSPFTPAAVATHFSRMKKELAAVSTSASDAYKLKNRDKFCKVMECIKNAARLVADHWFTLEDAKLSAVLDIIMAIGEDSIRSSVYVCGSSLYSCVRQFATCCMRQCTTCKREDPSALNADEKLDAIALPSVAEASLTALCNRDEVCRWEEIQAGVQQVVEMLRLAKAVFLNVHLPVERKTPLRPGVVGQLCSQFEKMSVDKVSLMLWHFGGLTWISRQLMPKWGAFRTAVQDAVRQYMVQAIGALTSDHFVMLSKALMKMLHKDGYTTVEGLLSTVVPANGGYRKKISGNLLRHDERSRDEDRRSSRRPHIYRV